MVAGSTATESTSNAEADEEQTETMVARSTTTESTPNAEVDEDAKFWNDYRLSDSIGKYPDAPGCDRYPESLACAYSKQTSSAYNVAILLQILQEWKESGKLLPTSELPQADEIVVHLRLGDALCAKHDFCGSAQPDCFQNSSDCFTNDGHRYAYSKPDYEAVLELIKEKVGGSLDNWKVVIVGNPYHWTRTTDPRQGDFSVDRKYVSDVKELFIKSGFPEVRVHGLDGFTPDEDFMYMTSARMLVLGGGGYSELCARVVSHAGGSIFRVGPPHPAP